MDMLNELKEIFANEPEFIKSTNYFFESHQCPERGEIMKVMMDYKVRTEKSDELIKLGKCPFCKKVYYHKTHETETEFI